MSHRIRAGVLSLCLALVAVPSTQAAEPGWYLLGFAGESSASGTSQNRMDDNLVDLFEANGLEVTDLSSTFDDSDTGYGLAGGYQLNDHFALEFAYVDLGSIDYRANVTVTDGVETADAEVGLGTSADGPVLSALGILPIGERFAVFGRVGLSLLSAEGKLRVTFDGESQRGRQSSQKSDLTYGAGAEFSLGRHFAIRLAWDRYLDVGTQDVTGDTDADLFTLGLRLSVGWFR